MIQRCRRHKERNILDHLPEAERPLVQRRLRAARALDDASAAKRELESIARSLAKKRPGAAASLREGLEQTVTVNQLGVTGSLLRTVESTNPVESMIEIVRDHSRRVKNCQHGEMALRWTAAGMLAAEGQFRRVKGTGRCHNCSPHSRPPPPTNPACSTSTKPPQPDRTILRTRTSLTEVHDDLDILRGHAGGAWSGRHWF